MFTVRTSKPGKGNKSYITTSKGGWNSCIQGYPTDKECNVLANCVGYANGRFNEIITELTGFEGNKFNTLNCNAEWFIERAKAAGLKVGNTPKPGAIMCWQRGTLDGGADGAGHVAVVEKVYDDNHVYTSESGYGASAFWNQHRYNKNGRWGIGSKYTFRGFIYNPEVKEEPPVVEELKVGDRVKIIAYGNGSSNGKAGRAYGIGWTRYITAIYKDRPFPYQVGNKGKTDSRNTTGFYTKSALKKI